MPDSVLFHSVSPIGETKADALPVKEIDSAVDFYTQVLGFTLVTQAEGKAALKRDGAVIGLAVNGEDPEQASCYFGVSDVDSLRDEIASKGIDTSEMRVDTYDGKSYRVFFAKEPYGVCFCFGQPVSE